MILDLIVVGVLLLSAVIACLRGFIREVLTIMGVLGGTLAAFAFGGALSPTMLRWLQPEPPEKGAEAEKIFGVVPPEMMADLLAYGTVFVIVVIILSVVSHFLSGFARKIGLGAVDRSLGVLFGLARGAAIVVLLYLLPFMLFDREARDAWFEGSRTQDYVENGAEWVHARIPGQMAEDARREAQEAARKNIEDAAGNARARLLGIEELRDGDADGTDSAEPAPADEQAPGYEREERRDMNELIRDNLND